MSEPLDKVRVQKLFTSAVTSCNKLSDLHARLQGYVTYTIYLLLGSGLLFPWNAFITAADYFESEFPVRWSSPDRLVHQLLQTF